MEQRSPQWFAARVGKVTASRVADVIAKTKTGWGASRANYMAELLAERLTGMAAPSYTNAAMDWGTLNEAEAVTAYQFYRDKDVVPVGFIEHPTIAMSGASPDGLVGNDGLCEIKCPNTSTHIDTLLTGKVPEKYVTQMMWQMACTGRAWCDFASYDPRMPEHLRLYVKRIERHSSTVVELEDAVRQFLAELDEKIAALESRFGDGPKPLRRNLEQSILMAG